MPITAQLLKSIYMHVMLVDFATPAYDEVIALRYKILKKPINFGFSVEGLTQEADHLQLACYDAVWNLQACLVLEPKGKGYVQMRQVAVDEPFQRKGIGTKLVVESERVGAELNFKTMMLHARNNAIPFYERLGYVKIGEPFEEVGMPHYRMEKKI